MVEYGARHLLIKFSGSRNPVSRRTHQSTAEVTAEAAKAELQTYFDKITAEGATQEVFAKYSKERSDCGSFAQGGDLGLFGSGAMQKQFEDGTASTPVPPPVHPAARHGWGLSHLLFRAPFPPPPPPPLPPPAPLSPPPPPLASLAPSPSLAVPSSSARAPTRMPAGWHDVGRHPLRFRLPPHLPLQVDAAVKLAPPDD